MQIKARGTSIVSANSRPEPLALFDASHGQPNWAQTGFTSREMHTNYAGLTEILCRFGWKCASFTKEPSLTRLSQARLLVIPSPTGRYNARKECWMPEPECLFTAESVKEILSFVQSGGRLLVFAYRFGDWFTRSNLRELISPLGCLLNDDAVLDLQLLRTSTPLEAFLDTPHSLLPLPWSREAISTVRWRTMATFTILPGANVRPLALSAGGGCISFNRSLRKISFASLPIAVVGIQGQGRFALFGGPHAFETGRFGLLAEPDNTRFLQNVLDWLLNDRPPNLTSEPATRYSTEPFLSTPALDFVTADETQADHHTVAYVERLLRRTGVLKALSRPKWMP